GFVDDYRTNLPPCPPGGPEAQCGPMDTETGGTVDGAGGFVDTAGVIVYEMSHPLNSGDAGHDFALHPGDAVGFFAFVRMFAGVQFGDTDFPGFRNYARIIVADTAPSTPLGQNVVLHPTDPNTGEAHVLIAFDEVTQPGTTGAYTTPAPNNLPGNFSLGNPPIAYEIYTSATFTEATVCISYAGITFTGPPQLLHNEGGLWTDVTTSVDTLNQIICGRVTSFSPFVLASETTIATLLRKVEALNLNRGEVRSLVAKVQAGQLQAFINELRAMVKSRRLPLPVAEEVARLAQLLGS